MPKKKKVETLEEKWQWSHWTYVGNVFDTPEHQAALAKLPTLKEKVAYKRKILNQQHYEKFGEYLNPDW